MRDWLVVLAICACSGKHDESRRAAKRPTLDKLTPSVPEGWTAAYDTAADRWSISDGRSEVAAIERAPADAVASPEAFLHHRQLTHAIDSRESVSAGFAFTAAGKTYVVRQVGARWVACESAHHDQVLALCKSLTGPQ